MSETRQQVLQMLQAGTITTEQAIELLDAMLEHSDTADDDTPHSPPPSYNPQTNAIPPDMDHLRSFWRIPFLISAAFLLATAFWLRTVYINANGTINFWFFCVWSLFIIAFIATTLTLASRTTTWLHVRIDEKEGNNINISLPLPLRFARWGLTIARGFVPDHVRPQLEMAETFLTTTGDELRTPDAEPIVIQVDDDDSHIQIYFG